MTTHLTSAEAAARLGVKRETLYAYVSRGLLDRTLSLDGRSSLFDSTQIDALRRTSRRSAQGELRTVITTSITQLDESGHRYRTRPVGELVDDSFESVADLIWQHEGSWTPDPDLMTAVHCAIGALPTTASMLDRFRVATAVASASDPMRSNPSPAAHANAGRSIINAAVASLGPTEDQPQEAGRRRRRRTSTPSTRGHR